MGPPVQGEKSQLKVKKSERKEFQFNFNSSLK